MTGFTCFIQVGSLTSPASPKHIRPTLGHLEQTVHISNGQTWQCPPTSAEESTPTATDSPNKPNAAQNMGSQTRCSTHSRDIPSSIASRAVPANAPHSSRLRRRNHGRSGSRPLGFTWHTVGTEVGPHELLDKRTKGNVMNMESRLSFRTKRSVSHGLDHTQRKDHPTGPYSNPTGPCSNPTGPWCIDLV